MLLHSLDGLTTGWGRESKKHQGRAMMLAKLMETAVANAYMSRLGGWRAQQRSNVI